MSLFLDVKGGLNNICRNVCIEKSHDFYLQRKKGLDDFLHLTNVDAKGQESLASDHMEGKGCVWHFQHFELDTIVLPLQNNRSLCLHPKGYLWTYSELFGQIYSSQIASTLRILCESPVISLNVTYFMWKSSQRSAFPKVGMSIYNDFVLCGGCSPRAHTGQLTPVLTSPEREDTLQMMM